MTTTYQTQLTDTTYNGWSNYETWNVVLWMMNDYGLYQTARQAARVDLLNPYQFFVDEMHDMNCQSTDDGVSWTDDNINQCEVNEALAELIED